MNQGTELGRDCHGWERIEANKEDEDDLKKEGPFLCVVSRIQIIAQHRHNADDSHRRRNRSLHQAPHYASQYDESKFQELLECKIQGTVGMLTLQEWEELTTGEPLRLEDLKDWSTNVLMDAIAQVEEYGRCTNNNEVLFHYMKSAT